MMQFLENYSLPLSRAALFIVYGWFGVLKILVLDSAAAPLVGALLEKTMPAIPLSGFFVFLGISELLLGTLWLIPRLEKTAFVLLVLHMATTFMPLILLPAITWEAFLVPTLTGQYIIKNIVLIALAASIVVQQKRASASPL